MLEDSEIAFKIWIVSFAIFFINITLATNFFQAQVGDTFFGKTQFFPAILALSFVCGFIAFLIGVIKASSFFVAKKKIKSPIKRYVAFLLFVLVLPLYAIWFLLSEAKIFSKKKGFFLQRLFIKKNIRGLLCTFFIVFLLLPVWVSGYFVVGYVTVEIAKQISGYEAVVESIVGTGSMYPTFPKGDKPTDIERSKQVVATANFISYPSGIEVFGNRFFDRSLKRGDIITFINKKTEAITKKEYGVATGFMKRLIALPGDTIELRSGSVYLNGEPLKEPYTAKPRSTFAEAFLEECKEINIPSGQIFVMGDNRKGSGDSREIGFVDINSIDHVLPVENQKGEWDKNWRDTNKDFDEKSKIRLNKEEYLKLLNEKRKEAGAKPLKYQPKLEQSAALRGKTILQYNDFSWEATKSAYTMKRAMVDVGYSNITYGETPTQGYFEEDELIDNQFQFPKTKDFLLNKEYQEIGIAEVEGEINGCPAQVVIQHFAGYIPPNYKKDTIDSWGEVISGLNNVIPSWEKAKEWKSINQDDLNKLLGLLYKRKNNAEAVYYRMKANQWLTTQEQQMVDFDKNLYDQANALAKKLNGNN